MEQSVTETWCKRWELNRMHKQRMVSKSKQKVKPITDDLNEDLKPKIAAEIPQYKKGKILKEHRLIL